MNTTKLLNNRHTQDDLFPYNIYVHQVYGYRAMVFNATFNNISVISWRSVLLVDETGVPGENYRPAASHCA